MIRFDSVEQFKNAIKRAKELKPQVEMVKFGQYTVYGNGGDYTVQFSKVDGHFCGECNCPARKECYHLVSAYQAHKIQVGIRRQVRAYESPSIANWTIETKEAA
jgi:hypothetical protein